MCCSSVKLKKMIDYEEIQVARVVKEREGLNWERYRYRGVCKGGSGRVMCERHKGGRRWRRGDTWRSGGGFKYWGGSDWLVGSGFQKGNGPFY